VSSAAIVDARALTRGLLIALLPGAQTPQTLFTGAPVCGHPRLRELHRGEEGREQIRGVRGADDPSDLAVAGPAAP
jgi:hypothetical protein